MLVARALSTCRSVFRHYPWPSGRKHRLLYPDSPDAQHQPCRRYRDLQTELTWLHTIEVPGPHRAPFMENQPPERVNASPAFP